MAVSYTYADMFYKISDELGGRSDLLANSTGETTPPIQLAIQTAIKKWQPERFWFNEIRTTGAFSTVATQEFYTSSDWSSITTCAHIDKMSVLISANRYFMEPRTAEYMEDISVNPTNTGQPVDYCYYNEQIRMYPIPDQIYPINILYTKRFAELTAASDTNVWTNEAEELIRLTAKWILYRDTLMDDNGTERMARAIWGAPGIPGALSTLKSQTMRMSATHKFKAAYF